MKSLQTDGQTDGLRMTGDQKSSLELSAQVSSKPVKTRTRSTDLIICSPLNEKYSSSVMWFLYRTERFELNYN